jgi:hypothetical protein
MLEQEQDVQFQLKHNSWDRSNATFAFSSTGLGRYLSCTNSASHCSFVSVTRR